MEVHALSAAFLALAMEEEEVDSMLRSPPTSHGSKTNDSSRSAGKTDDAASSGLVNGKLSPPALKKKLDRLRTALAARAQYISRELVAAEIRGERLLAQLSEAEVELRVKSSALVDALAQRSDAQGQLAEIKKRLTALEAEHVSNLADISEASRESTRQANWHIDQVASQRSAADSAAAPASRHAAAAESKLRDAPISPASVLATLQGAFGRAVVEAGGKAVEERQSRRSLAWEQWSNGTRARKRLAWLTRKTLLFSLLRRIRIGRFAILLASGLYAPADGPGRRAIWKCADGQNGRPHPLFDADWYLKHSPDIAGSELSPAVHYLRAGDSEGRNPHPLFDVRWYREQYSEQLKTWSLTTLEHYIMVGARQGLQPHPLFDTMYYAPEAPEVFEGGMNPLSHYLSIGWRKGLSPHPLFDNDWYLQENPDVALAQVSPLLHYVLSGLREMRDPHPLFNVTFYQQTNPDVHALGLDPLRHYISKGWREGRKPCEIFDPRYYLNANPDVAASGTEPLRHYLTRGAWERRCVTEGLEAEAVAARVPAEIVAGRTPLEAWARSGFPALERTVTLAEGDGLIAPEGFAPTRLRRNVQADAGLFEQLADASRKISPDNYSWQSYLAISGTIQSTERQRIEQLSLPAPKLISVSSGGEAAAASKLSFPPHASPDVSIVIPVFNHLKFTVECLASLAGARGGPSFEVIVGDDASTDETAAVLGQVPGLLLVRAALNQGFLRNVNAAAAKARGRVLVILNNDVQVTDGWLEPLVRSLDDPTVGLAAPKMLFPNGRLQEAGARLELDGTSRMIGLFDDPNLPRYDYARDIDYASGACIAVRRTDFEKLKGFDLEYSPAYCEDADLCMRIRNMGLRIRYEPASQIYHHLSLTSNALPGGYKVRQVRCNQQKLMERWSERIDADNQVRIIAFYLPQFHTVPENDRWWGAGFTEWKNVQRALPNFVSHYQPRRPGELGYYDLSNPATMEAQAALARAYGVHGFCFYYYSFSGRRMLEKPVDLMMERGSPDIPFCLCWANENWTRTWDGGDKSVLLAQVHRPDDDVVIIEDIIRYLTSPNYIRINGKPLLAVYRPQLLPDARRTAETWRRICREQGVGEIYLAMVEVFEHARRQPDPKSWGYDASIEFPPTGMGEPVPPPGDMLNPRFKGTVCDYRRMAERYMQESVPGFTRFRGVTPSWDNTARRQDDGYVFHHATPGAFQAWLEAVIDQTRDQNHGDERIVFVNAWNEWAEGACLEPDERFGRGWLEAVRNAQTSDLILPTRKPQGWQ